MKRLFYLTMALVLLVGIVPVSGISQANVEATTNPTAIFYAADGMRQDLMERYAAEGSMPTYAALMAQGVAGNNGVVQAFPPNTGVGWYTLATGAYPGETGSTNNTYFRTGDTFQQPDSCLYLRACCRRIQLRKLPNGLARKSSQWSGRVGRAPPPNCKVRS